MSKTLEKAKKELRDRLGKGATICPCCNQTVELIKLEFSKKMIETLKEFYKEHGADPGNAKIMFPHYIENKNFRDLEEWCLIEQVGEILFTYKITQLGIDFLDDKVDVPAWMIIYDGSIHQQPKVFSSLAEIMGEKT